MTKAIMGFKCPRCQGICHTRTSRPASRETVERYYVCRSTECGFVFKTFHVFSRYLCRPVPPATATEQAPATPQRDKDSYSSPFLH